MRTNSTHPAICYCTSCLANGITLASQPRQRTARATVRDILPSLSDAIGRAFYRHTAAFLIITLLACIGLAALSFAATRAMLPQHTSTRMQHPLYCVLLAPSHAFPTGGRHCSTDLRIFDLPALYR